MSEFKEVVSGDIDFGLAWWERRKVDRIDVGVAAEHELQFEPLDFLHTRLGIAGWRERFCDVGTPSDDLLVLVVVEYGRNLYVSSQ